MVKSQRLNGFTISAVQSPLEYSNTLLDKYSPQHETLQI